MVGAGRSVILEFDEPDLAAQIPPCVDCIAAALMCGFPLLKPPAVNHEDVLVGCDRLQEFKDAKASQLRRLVRFHFYRVEKTLFGEIMTPLRFQEQWTLDSKFRKSLKEDERFEKWRVAVCEKLMKNRRSVLAIEGTRTSYGKIHGDPETLAAMARFHENGGI